MGARGKTQCRYSKRRSHARCLLRLPLNGCACCTWPLCKRVARVAYRKRKEVGNVPHSITGRYDASSRISIKEGIHHVIDHLPRVWRHSFRQSFCLRPLRLSSPRRKYSAGNTHRPGHSKPALLHRVRGGVTARCSFLHVVRGTSWNPRPFRRIPALANPPSSCPAASARVAHAARAKVKRARGSQMPKMRIHACHHRRAGLFDYLGFHGRRQHRKPLRQMRL